jgi:hypothetical protein
MIRTAAITLLLLACTGLSLASDKVTVAGWISDRSCAMARAKSGTYTATNPDCAMDCVAKGEQMVMIAEKEKAVYVIDNPDVAKDHFAEHLEVSGTLDQSSNKLHITSIKDLGDYQGPACARKKLKK